MTAIRAPSPNCPGCGILKTTDNCGVRNLRTGRSFSTYCYQCRSNGLRRYRHANPVNYVWSAAKNRARQLKIPFTIALEDIVIPDSCPILGIPLIWSGGQRTSNTPSLDRIDPPLGYTPTNIAVISWRANRLKSDATPDELRRLAAYSTSPRNPND